MDKKDIQNKFGDQYIADEYTFKMGIDIRFTSHFAERFKKLNVLETCTGAGFTTISLARVANQVITVEIDKMHQAQAIQNIEKAGLLNKVRFIHGNIIDSNILDRLPTVDAVFIDPDWADSGLNHVYKFINSNTQPPSDMILNIMLKITNNIAIVLPPDINSVEFIDLPIHERESIFLGNSHELYCLYFGKLMIKEGNTEFRVNT
jgi:16S rRNA G966 N2-methylase RsmD